jgi:hypothetical protein
MNSNFISKADYAYQIRTNRLDQILESTDEDADVMLDSAESEAIGLMRKFLDQKYNMDLELSKSGDARHTVLLRIAKVLTIYFIYERVPDEMVPARVVKNYEDVMAMLEKIEDGDGAIPGLAPILVADPNSTTGESKPYTKRRWGSQPKRSNDGGNPSYLDR